MKSMSIIKLFLLILGALSLTNGIYRPGPFFHEGKNPLKQCQEGTEGVDNPEAQFTKAYTEDYEFTLKTFEGKSLNLNSMQLASDKLQRLVVRRFKSRKAIDINKGLFLRFSLSSYRYSTAAQAKEVFKSHRMVILSEPEEMRSKSPMLVLLREQVIYILNGSCQFSLDHMALIEDELEKVVFQGQKQQKEYSIKRDCGGAVSNGGSL